MTVADDLRAAKRTRQFYSARDFETSSSQIEDVDLIAEDLRRKAQMIIAATCVGETLADQVADATMLMRMLGVHPDDKFAPSVTGSLPRHPTATR